LLVGLFALVGVPYYFLRTRPLTQALASTARALGVFALMAITIGVVDTVVFYAFAS
jgi:hypothetical protein